MNKLKLALASCALLGTSSLVQAQAIDSVTMTSDPDDVVFTLRADKTLPTPSVRTYEGQVRIRFPESNAPSSIQVAGDGSAIKGVDVRSGSRDSAVVRIDLGDTSKLSAQDVRVEARKHIAVVRIARDLLPPMREARSEAAKKVEAPAPAPAVAQPAAQPAAAPKPAAAATPAALSKPKADKPLANSLATSGSSSPMPMLIAVSAILALAYGAMRLLMKKQKSDGRAAAPIDIVAQKRIGPRHQLVIVRAFGREHLLSIQGGTTTPIATSDDLDESLPLTATRALPAGLEMEPKRSSDRVPASPRSELAKKEEEPAFGSELIRVALAQRLKESGKVKQAEEQGAPAAQDDKALSQAVAGLVKLRRQAQSS